VDLVFAPRYGGSPARRRFGGGAQSNIVDGIGEAQNDFPMAKLVFQAKIDRIERRAEIMGRSGLQAPFYSPLVEEVRARILQNDAHTDTH